jgi:phage/plasmid-like protein (TIGR03299 family)
MPHAITIRPDGTEEFFAAGSTPVWHRIGQRVERALSTQAALRMAALDWTVEARPIFVDGQDGAVPEVPTHKAIVRTDTQALLGVVGKRYQPVQNFQTFEWLDEVIGPGKAVYETAGSLHGGKVVWSLVKLPGELRIASTDDVVKPFILVVNSHDGSIAFRALNTSIRVVCQNTLTLALRHAGPDSISVKHTESIHDRLADAQEVLGLAISKHREFEVQMNRLAQVRLTKRTFSSYLDRVLGPVPKPTEDDPEPEVSTARQQVVANFDHELQRLKGIEHTAWAAFNAVSQYVDWERPTRGTNGSARDERRFEAMMLGVGAELKRKAWAEALNLARVN